MEIDPEFEAVLDFLRESWGFDFSGYKRSSLMRRVGRRMSQVGIDSFAEYLDYLQVHPEEYTALFNTILINVTGFLRDSDAWLHLRSDVLPPILEGCKPHEQIRVWSAGCASGEEAYSIAMVFAELLGLEEVRERVKIYATDVDEEALVQARHATYGEREVSMIPDELRAKYFELRGQRYVFHRELRRSVIFGRNDLVQDAPISRVDLLICRNTLMYFNAETQTRILGRFHFALNDTAALFLGKAEMLLSHTTLFEPIDLKRRFFRKLPRPTFNGGALPGGGNGSGRQQPPPTAIDQLRGEAMAASPTATLVVTAGGALGLANHRAETLFGLSPRDVGRPFTDLDASYRPVELRSSIEQAQRERRAVWLREVEWARAPGESVWLDMQIAPLIGAEGAVLGCVVYVSDVTRHRKLQGELEYANRQLETAYEELQSTVEELETTNEELQSTNEELETMNEELQSTNDELQTINDELQKRTRELDEANGFLGSILRSLRTAVIVVDRDLTVVVWNRRAENLWGLRQEEVVGQHLLNPDVGLPTDRVRPLIRNALGTGEDSDPITMAVVNRRGREVEMRVLCSPLRPPEADPIGAIVVIDELTPAAGENG